MPRQIWKNKPDSKLALPQLSTLGAITSKEMRGNHLVAQHENGTAIIKDAVLNENAPLSSLYWGIQAYKDASGNKRLFCSTADGTYPVGWENIKYDDEAVNTIFYDVGRTSTSNNIAGLITEEDGKLKVYIGEGYENLSVGVGSVVSEVSREDLGNGLIKITFNQSGNISSNRYYFAIGAIGYSELCNITVDIVEKNSNLNLFGGDFNGDRGVIVTTGVSSFSLTNTQNDSNFRPFIFGANVGDYFVINTKRTQITKTSTPKPFTEGIVPNGSLKVACDWTSTNIPYSLVIKDFSSSVIYDNTYCYPVGQVYAPVRNSDTYSLLINQLYKGLYKDSIKVEQGAIGYYNTINKDGYINFSHSFHEYHTQMLIYKDNLTQDKMEEELAKDIYLPSYHHQPNSVINTYGISGMSAMYLYQPALTSAEIDTELEKDIYLPKTQFDIPNWKGE